ncbi:MAG: type I-E CRISPR-associated endonuclease Cas1 [Fibrobacter sp.]|nr:type I-E CRISPR-associated endonuclease Cas1 [Fibrobacter sp.]
MAVIFKKFNKCVPAFSGRWTPLYLEHGRLEVDDSSLKWISATGSVMRLPVARLSAVLMGPGTTVTHAAITSMSRLNTPIAWVGEDGVHFYAFGVNVNEKCQTAMDHAVLYANKEKRLNVAREMFAYRFPKVDVSTKSVAELRGMEGMRIRKLYEECANKYGVLWKGRNSSGQIKHLGKRDPINRMLTIANYTLYCICLSAVCTMGYIPSLGFVHTDGKIPFVYDIADLYKEEITIRPCFETYGEFGDVGRDGALALVKEAVEKHKLITRIPKDLKRLIC